jgi:hypothetical protein
MKHVDGFPKTDRGRANKDESRQHRQVFLAQTAEFSDIRGRGVTSEASMLCGDSVAAPLWEV